MNQLHHCSFCGEHLVNRRWSHPGPGEVRICGECVALCVGLMAKGNNHWRPAIDGQTNDAGGLIDITPETENVT